MKCRVVVAVVFFLIISDAKTIERIPLKQVDSDALLADASFDPLVNVGDSGFVEIGWFPKEYWATIDIPNTPNVSIMVVVQADITLFGSFEFYSRDEVLRGMTVTYTRGSNRLILKPLQTAKGTHYDIFLTFIENMMAQAMGEAGKHMYFFVFNNLDNGKRILDPYEEGRLRIQLTARDGTTMYGEVETPLNALFVPRKCPNGKVAHVSWKYCPWTGVRLPD